MYKRILVPVDGSETAKQALHAAIVLAGEQGAILRIVHISEENPVYVSMDTLPYPPSDLMDALRKEGEKILDEALTSARSANIRADGNLLVVDRPGHRISDAIEEEAEAWNADLIVIGTHGRRGFRRLLLGSVAENLIRISKKPVLLIRGA